MKKIFSTLILIISYPIKLLRRSKFDNFVGGLIFGALFSLLVNIFTFQIQEIIQKQRILEALENEIVSNALTAEQIAVQNKKNIEDKSGYNPFSYLDRYSRDLWEQSSEPLQYIAQLDQSIQIPLLGYYSWTIPSQNGMLTRLENFTADKLKNCSPIGEVINVNDSDYCRQWNAVLLDSERSIALDVAVESFKLLKIFHPTRDRLNNWFLKLIMGNKSTKILSGDVD